MRPGTSQEDGERPAYGVIEPLSALDKPIDVASTVERDIADEPIASESRSSRRLD